MRITVYAEHGVDWPLWGPNGLLDEESLPLTEGTRRAVRAWLYAYDDRRGEVPAWVPPSGAVGADGEEQAWVEDGERLRSVIEAELGVGYEAFSRPRADPAFAPSEIRDTTALRHGRREHRVGLAASWHHRGVTTWFVTVFGTTTDELLVEYEARSPESAPARGVRAAGRVADR